MPGTVLSSWHTVKNERLYSFLMEYLYLYILRFNIIIITLSIPRHTSKSFSSSSQLFHYFPYSEKKKKKKTASSTGHSGERGVVDLVEDSLGASSMCWEPILSVKHIYTGDKQGASTLLKSAERTVTRTDCSESFMSVVCSVRDTVGCV